MTISLSYAQLFGSYIIYNYLSNILLAVIFFLQFLEIRYYVIYAEKDQFREIIKKLESDSYFSAYKYNNGRNSPSGYFIGRYCLGYIDTLDKYEDGENIKILTTLDYFKKITREKNIECVFTDIKQEDGETSKISIYSRYGIYKRFYYGQMNLNLGTIRPLGQQQEIVDSISDIYNQKKRATVFIHGVSYAGKSSIGYLLAKKYNGRFCHSFNPTDPGDQIGYLINNMTADMNDTVPIIIVLEEIDCIIEAIHTNSILFNKEVPTSVYNKSTWSSFLDDMIFYKNVILILTSNKSKEYIDSLDPAYLRKGRVNEYYHMNKPLEI